MMNKTVSVAINVHVAILNVKALLTSWSIPVHHNVYIQCHVDIGSILIKILVVRCLSVTEGHRKRFDLEASVPVSLTMERTMLELGDLCERQSWH